MSTTQTALDTVRNRKLAYWKLYKGTIRVSQCDREENPDGSHDVAVALFEEELQTRLTDPGTYTVNIYRSVNGDKGGYRYTFTISQNDQPRMSNYGRSSFDHEDLRKSVEREVRMFMMLEDINKKVDAIIEVIAAKTTEGKEDDDKAFEFIKTLAGVAMKQKAGLPAKSGGFSNL